MCKQAVKTITALFTIVLVLSCTMVTSIFADDTATQSDNILGHLSTPYFDSSVDDQSTFIFDEGFYYVEYTKDLLSADITFTGVSGYQYVYHPISWAGGYHFYLYLPDDDIKVRFGTAFSSVKVYKATVNGKEVVDYTHERGQIDSVLAGDEPLTGIEPGLYYISMFPADSSSSLESSITSNLSSIDITYNGYGSTVDFYVYLYDLPNNNELTYTLTYLLDYGFVNLYYADFVVSDESYNQGYEAGYEAGYNEGEEAGYSEGYQTGHTAGYNEGYTAGETAGQEAGYNQGYTAGESAGYEIGYDEGYQAGLDQGTGSYNEGYQAGYADGTINGQNVDEIVNNGISGFFEGLSTFFSPFFSIGIGNLTVSTVLEVVIFAFFILLIVKIIRGT